MNFLLNPATIPVSASALTAPIRRVWRSACLLALLAAWMLQASAAPPQAASLDRPTLTSGGGATGAGSVGITGTIGQPAADVMAGPGVFLQGGFWSAFAVPLSAAAVDPTDGLLSTSDWLLVWEAGGGWAAAGQEGSGGNPASYRIVTNHSAGDEVGSFSFLRTASYAPEAQGGLLGVDVRFDALCKDPGTTQVGAALAQAGTYYFTAPVSLNSSVSWQSIGWTNLTAADFRARTSEMDHPDFTLKGARMLLGYYFLTPAGTGTGEFTLGVDNFSAHQNPAPPPSYVVWTNTAGGNWSTVANWTPHRIPGAGDIAVIAAPGTYAVKIDSGATCSMLLLGGSPGTQTLNWQYGGFTGNLYVEPNAVVNLTGSSLSLAGTIRNRGRILWPQGNVLSWRYEAGARLENEPEGRIDIEGTGSFYWMGTDPRLFQNLGTLRVAAGMGKVNVFAKIKLVNQGEILVESGTFAVHDLLSRGLVSVAEEATLELDGGTVQLESGHLFQGPGKWWIKGNSEVHGALNPPAVYTVSESIRFDGELNSTLWWTNGTLSGDLTIGRSGTLNLLANGAGSLWMKGVVTNQGLFRWTGSRDNWIWYEGGRLENLPGGLVEVDFDATLGLPAGAYLRNYGTVRKSGGTDQASFRGVGAHHNYGLLDVQSGTLEFLHGLASSGEIHVETGAVLSFTGGDCRFGPAHRFTGEGLCSFGGSSVHILGPMAGTVQFRMVYGTVFDATLDANLSWDYGNMSGTLSVGTNGLLTLNAPGSLEGTVVNQGRILWPAGPAASWRWEDGATLENRAGGLFEIQGDHRLYAGGIGMRIDNAGTWRKSQGTSAMRIDPNFSFQNSGSVEVQSGMIAFQGAYLASPSAILLVQLGGETEGVGYAQAQFGKPLGLAGTFGVTLAEGYMPRVGARFGVLEYPSRTGSFANLTGLDLGGGIHLVPQFSSTGLSLLATNGVLPSVGISIEPGSLRVTWPAEDSGWRLYSATNLIAPEWKLVPLPAGSTVDLLPAHPQEFFRVGSP